MKYMVGLFFLSGCLSTPGGKELQSLTSDLADYVRQTYYIPISNDPDFPAPTLILRRAPCSPIPVRMADRGDTLAKKVAFTFDACSALHPGDLDSAIVRVLLEKKAAATFFLGGKWVCDRVADARELAALNDFELGNHSYLHSHMTQVSPERLSAEIQWAQDLIYTVTGRVPRYFRPPYVEWSDTVVEAAARAGMTTVLGNLPSGDPAPSSTKSRLISWVLWKLKPGSIVIMHVNGRGWHTAEALPVLVDSVRGRGFELVTISELLR